MRDMVVSMSIRRMLACGKMRCSSSSMRWVPLPVQLIRLLPQFGQLWSSGRE